MSFDARLLLLTQSRSKSLADAKPNGRIRQDVFGEEVVDVKHRNESETVRTASDSAQRMKWIQLFRNQGTKALVVR